MKRLGSNRYPPPTSCKVAALVDPQLHASWLSLSRLNLCLGVACHVSRPRYVSYHSHRPLCTSSGRSIHGVSRTTSRSAPGGLRSSPCVLFQYTPANCRAIPQVRAAAKNQRRSRLIGPPTLTASSKILIVLFPVSRPRARNASVRLPLSIPVPL